MLTSYQYRDKVSTALERDELVLFVGAGVEFGAYPLWPSTLARLGERCGVEIDLQLSPPRQAQQAKDADLTGYNEIIFDIFSKWSPNIQRLVQVLSVLYPVSILTTNYTDILSDSFSLFNYESFAYPNIKLEDFGKKGVFFIHGVVPRHLLNKDLEIVLAEDEFQQAYSPTSPMRTVLQDYIRRHSVLFVGYSFDDVYVVDVLKLIRETELNSNPRTPLRHFALLGIGSNDQNMIDVDFIATKGEQLKELGIQVIWFDKSKDFNDLYELVRSWRKTQFDGTTIQEDTPVQQDTIRPGRSR